MRVRLTQQFVDKAKIRDEDVANNSGRTLYWDQATPGFGGHSEGASILRLQVPC
jgi:hypothetical protein